MDNSHYYIASVSFGKDSLAMLLLIFEHPDKYPLDEVIFFDWGMEFQAIYNNRDKVIPLLQEKGIKFTQLTYPYSFKYMFSEKPITKKNGTTQLGYGWCGGRCRWGTDRKKATIRKYYSNSLKDKNIVEYIGIAADELPRIEKAKERGQILPLVDFNMTEEDALNYCYKSGYNWEEEGIELYSILDRVSCWCCKNKNLKELRQIYKFLPRTWEGLKELQSLTPFPYKQYRYKGQPCCTIENLEKRFQDELGG